MTSVRAYRGISAEQRRVDRRRSLLNAVAQTVGEVGIVATTVDAVCARAGLTKRYFYEAFAGLDQAFAAELDDLFLELGERMRAALHGRHLVAERRAHIVVQTLVETLTSDPGLARLYVEAPAHPLLLSRRDQAIETFTQYLLTDVLEFPGRRRPSIRRDLAVRIVVAGTTDLVTSWLAGAIEADESTLIRTVAAVGLAAAAAL